MSLLQQGGGAFWHYGTLSDFLCGGLLCKNFEIHLVHIVKTGINHC